MDGRKSYSHSSWKPEIMFALSNEVRGQSCDWVMTKPFLNSFEQTFYAPVFMSVKLWNVFCCFLKLLPHAIVQSQMFIHSSIHSQIDFPFFIPNMLTSVNFIEEQEKIFLVSINREKYLSRKGGLLKTHQGFTKTHKDFFFLFSNSLLICKDFHFSSLMPLHITKDICGFSYMSMS